MPSAHTPERKRKVSDDGSSALALYSVSLEGIQSSRVPMRRIYAPFRALSGYTRMQIRAKGAAIRSTGVFGDQTARALYACGKRVGGEKGKACLSEDANQTFRLPSPRHPSRQPHLRRKRNIHTQLQLYTPVDAPTRPVQRNIRTVSSHPHHLALFSDTLVFNIAGSAH